MLTSQPEIFLEDWHALVRWSWTVALCVRMRKTLTTAQFMGYFRFSFVAVLLCSKVFRVIIQAYIFQNLMGFVCIHSAFAHGLPQKPFTVCDYALKTSCINAAFGFSLFYVFKICWNFPVSATCIALTYRGQVLLFRPLVTLHGLCSKTSINMYRQSFWGANYVTEVSLGSTALA